jgi:hypothetical protein
MIFPAWFIDEKRWLPGTGFVLRQPDQETARSKVSDRETVPTVAQHLIQRMVDILADEPHRTVAQKEMSASDME